MPISLSRTTVAAARDPRPSFSGITSPFPTFPPSPVLGADAIALANAAMQAIRCIAMRACCTNNCPVGIATQKDYLRRRLEIQKSALQLKNFLDASVDLMKVMARACGYNHFNKFNHEDLTTSNKTMAELTGIQFSGV